MKTKPIPKTQIGLNKKQKEILKSFVGKMPIRYGEYASDFTLLKSLQKGQRKYRKTLDKLSEN
ncbi:hypothetical protein ABHN03_16525 [Paenibacillus sp. NRS-1775]|uniref:hypothetical protein n=1 Tax=unclassified Paenibacillus TaxID=185978 RepID=UPI003D2E5F13